MTNLFSFLRGKTRYRAHFMTMLVCGAFDPLYYSPVDVNGDVLGPALPVVHNQLLCFADVEREVVSLAPQ